MKRKLVPGAFGLSLLLSLLLHLGLLFPPYGLIHFDLSLRPPPPPLQARLMPPAPPPPRPAPPPPPRKTAPPRKAAAHPAALPSMLHGSDAAAPALPAAPPAEATRAAGEGAPQAPAAPAVPAAPPEVPVLRDGRPWPARGRVVYDVHRGDGGLILGQTVHTWQHDEQHYTMRAEIETTGLAALLKSFRYVQQSSGRLGLGGLVPERFSVEQSGRRPETAEFDWAAGSVHITRPKGEKHAPIVPGDQDVLSLWHQLAFGSALADGGRLTVVSGKGAAAAQVSHVGEETLALPQGPEAAEHWAVRADDGSLRVDLWLATGHGDVPVRIRIEDRDGDVVDQVAHEIEVEGNPDLPPPPPTAPMAGGSGPDYSP